MKTIIYNKKARFNYSILEEYEAGMELFGTEVKSLRNGKANIQEAFIRVYKGELIVQNMNISPYAFGNLENHEPLRKRKLLLHKREIFKIEKEVKEKGLAIIPISLYFNNKGIVKLKIGLGKGKKLYDKREAIKEREDKIKIKRNLKT